jgi:hypothetical protein
VRAAAEAVLVAASAALEGDLAAEAEVSEVSVAAAVVLAAAEPEEAGNFFQAEEKQTI